MKERPILFSGPMVRAILDGRKTQTRRALKLPGGGQPLPSDNRPWRQASDGLWYAWADNTPVGYGLRCPYGSRGDRLWVKETWRSGPGHWDLMAPRELPERAPIRYEVDGVVLGGSDGFRDASGRIATGRIRQSIFMRRWMSRITLEVMGVRVERLQDISEEDARAEGLTRLPSVDGSLTWWGAAGASYLSPRRAFEALWASINGAESWTANPWVWCVSFRQAETKREEA